MKRFATMLAALLLGACATAPEEEQAAAPEDPRLGPRVQQVCFINSIRSWSSLPGERNALIVRMANRKEYRLTLAGACDPNWAMLEIAIVGRGGSSCFSAGDRVITDARAPGASTCTIVRINEWYPEYEEAAPAAKEL
jgi:hypothetical protein